MSYRNRIHLLKLRTVCQEERVLLYVSYSSVQKYESYIFFVLGDPPHGNIFKTWMSYRRDFQIQREFSCYVLGYCFARVSVYLSKVKLTFWKSHIFPNSNIKLLRLIFQSTHSLVICHYSSKQLVPRSYKNRLFINALFLNATSFSALAIRACDFKPII